jgi:hypothetical protein
MRQVNLPTGDFYRVEKRAAGQDVLTQLLCVAGDNNPRLGASYPGEARERLRFPHHLTWM